MKTAIRKISVSILFYTIVLLSSYSNVFAEDIEIYNRTQTIPNVLFVIDTSGSMDEYISGSSGPTRLDVVQDAFTTLLSQSYSTLNVGIMDFRSWTGSGVDMPVADVNQLARNVEPGVASTTESYAELLTRSVNALTADSSTPTVEALYEAALYFRGEEPHEGDRDEPHTSWNDSSSKYEGGHWTSAGLRTYTGGTINQVGAHYCGQAPHPSGAPYGECTTPFPGSCTYFPSETTTSNQCQGWTCTGGYVTGSDGNTTCQGWTCTGGYVTVTNTTPAYTRCRETEDRLVGSKYVSPIQTACTENYIVLLSDGIPTEDDYWTDQGIKGLTGNSTCDDLSALGITDPTIIDEGACGVDLVRYLNTVDQSSSTAGTNQPGNQFITTHTIGFQLGATSEGKKYLDELAKAGGGDFYDAADPTSLATSLQNIVASITNKPRVISRIATTLDLSNLGANRQEVYMPMFTYKANEPRWPGNMKGFLANSVGVLEGIGTPPKPAFITEMIDTDNNGTPDTLVPAMNPAVQSFWSGSADGGDVTQGGVAGILNPVGRKLLTENGSGGLMDLDTGVTALNGNPSLFGLPSGTTTAEIDRLISWVNGFDVFDEDGDSNTSEPRNFVGDPLHTDPIILNYDTDGDLTTVEKHVAFFMTNEGILHGVDVTSNTTASELFGFLPNELLANLDPLQKNVGGTSKIYGLDGPLVYFQEGGLTQIDGKKFLFFGMRRGGMNYYALEVTDPANPSLVWKIEGGSGDFQELGQTWSTPIVTKVNHGGSDKVALVFGGGYDADQDTVVSRTADDQGRAVYIVDALNDSDSDGFADVLWSVGPSSSADSHDLNLSISNSIPGDVTVIDFDSDSVADRLYFADVGGRVWRVDMQSPVGGSTGYQLADLADNTVANNRRFFSRPVAALTSNGKLAIAIGSGNRAHPLQGVGNVNRVTDRFYTLYDPNPTTVPSTTPSVIDDSDLQDLTGVTTGFTSGTALGWRIDLATDEKVFNEAMILLGEVFFTTYIPPANSCSNIPDGGNFYALSVEGKPIRNLDSSVDGSFDISKSINTFGIVPGFTPFVDGSGSGNVSVIFGGNSELLKSGDSLIDRFWTNNP